MRRATRAAAALCALLAASCRETGVIPRHRIDGGEPARGARAITAHGCGSCHVIPGVPAAEGRVGPPLTDFADRAYIAGRLPNEPASLLRWIRDPQQVDSLTVMPNLGVSEQDARDIASFLYTLGSNRLGPPHPIPASRIPGH